MQTQRDVSKQKPTWWHTIGRSKVGISKTREATTLVVSLPPKFTRVALKSWQTWRLDQPLQSHPKVNTDTNPLVYSTEPRTTHNHIENPLNRHRNVSLHIRQCGDHTVTTLIRSQLDDVHRRALKPEFPRFEKNNVSRSRPK